MSCCLRNSVAEICLQHLKAMASDYKENMLKCIRSLFYPLVLRMSKFEISETQLWDTKQENYVLGTKNAGRDQKLSFALKCSLS